MSRSGRLQASRGELVSLAERLTHLRVLRIAFAAIAVAVGASTTGLPVALLVEVTAAYLAVIVVLEIARGVSGQRAVALVGAAVLVDALYLAWVVYLTGGTQSPLRVLVVAHVVAVTLLASYRTGIKLAAWYSLLVLATSYAQAAGLLDARELAVSALPGGGEFSRATVFGIGALWLVTLVAAACSALNERELRGQKIDLEELARTVAEIDRSAAPSDIPRILVEEVGRVFGVGRGLVLAAPPGAELAVVAARGIDVAPTMEPGADPLMVRAWEQRSTQLVRRVDPGTDPRLAAALPQARNLLVVPMFLDRGRPFGILVLEWPGRGAGIKQWVVDLVEQFAAHGALALHNAWLLEEVRERLEENRRLQAELREQNAVLDTRVRERTMELSETVDELRAVDAQRRDLLSRLVGAEEEERRRIAADVHDGPVQLLVVASMQLQILAKTLGDDVAPAAVDRVDGVVGTLNDAIQGMRSLIFELRPLELDHEGLAPALRQLGSRLEPETECRVVDRLEGEPSGETRTIMYRIAQEALANIRKHAHAHHVEIVLEQDDDGYVIRIHDDGVGFQPPALLHSIPGHLGLSSMRERAEMARGTCRISSEPGQGTVVEVRLPVDGTPAASVLAAGAGSRSSHGARRARDRGLRLVPGGTSS
jgi:signal transduction histidine kinase